MSGGGINSMISQMGQPASSSGGFSNSGGSQQQAQPQMNWQTGQPVAQPAAPANPTGWNRPTFSADPNRMSLAQNTWLNSPDGATATAGVNARNLAAFNTTQTPIDRNTFNKTRNVTVGGGDGGDYTTTENYFDQAGYDQALAAQKSNTYTPLSNQDAFNQALRENIQAGMGNYGKMVQNANEYGTSMADVQRAIGPNTDVYTYMNRPNYQQYSPANNQFNPTIYQSNYQDYNTGNRMGVSQYGQGTSNPYGIGLDLASTPFNPYSNGYQTTPFTAPQAQTYYPSVPQSNYGPSRAIVGRSAGMRGTPNVVARKAEGGIASLMDKE